MPNPKISMAFQKVKEVFKSSKSNSEPDYTQIEPPEPSSSNMPPQAAPVLSNSSKGKRKEINVSIILVAPLADVIGNGLDERASIWWSPLLGTKAPHPIDKARKRVRTKEEKVWCWLDNASSLREVNCWVTPMFGFREEHRKMSDCFSFNNRIDYSQHLPGRTSQQHRNEEER